MDFPEFFVTNITDEDVALNSKLEHLYNHEFSDGRFFQVVFSDEKEAHIKFAPRTMMKVVYLKDKDDIDGFQLIKVVSGKETEKIKLSKFNMEQLRCFLDFINCIDLKGISSRRINLADDSLLELDAETKRKVATLLSSTEGGEIVCDLLDKGLITSQDLVNTGYRKQQLEKFHSMLFEDGLNKYKLEIDRPKTKDEIAWQHFFMQNQWIFRYGLDYRFQGVLQKEFHASDTNAAGRDGVISDFLLGDKRFTTFVELKLPTTDLFSNYQNRANSWRLSNSLIDAYSQILEQKASGQIKVETTKELLDDFNNEISQRSYDSRTILIVGCCSQIKSDPPGVQRIKEKTFELFRRDSRNIDIVTYDELYERARFIVNNENQYKKLRKNMIHENI
jgi:Domain of unknown function (DUF4263)